MPFHDLQILTLWGVGNTSQAYPDVRNRIDGYTRLILVGSKNIVSQTSSFGGKFYRSSL